MSSTLTGIAPEPCALEQTMPLRGPDLLDMVFADYVDEAPAPEEAAA